MAEKKKSLQDLLEEQKKEEVYDMGSPQVVDKPLKKSGWVRKLTLTVVWICVGLVVLGVGWYIYDWQTSKVTYITMIQPVEGSSVQGPLSVVKFSADRKIYYEDLSLFKIRNSEDKEMDGVLSMPKKGAKGVKEFSWIPREPLVAGDYHGVLGGDKVVYNTFDFKVFEVEKVLPKETTPTTPKPAVPAESDFLKQLDKNMGNG